MQAWLEALREYFVRLEESAAELDAAVETADAFTREGAFAGLHEAAAAVEQCLSQMEQRIEQRQQLLARDDAPVRAYQLRQCLKALEGHDLFGTEAAALLKRCDVIEQMIERVREHALSLFVCQFHLMDTNSHFLRLMMPEANLQPSSRLPNRMHRGGGLLDQKG